MFTERLQILLSRTQRRQVEREARRRGMSVGALIREALDARTHPAAPAERRDAFEAIRGFAGGRFVAPDELERIVDDEREQQIRRVRARVSR